MKPLSFTHYLASKRSVDDRALNSSVWQALTRSMEEQFGDKPCRILEIGAGTGTMLQRMAASGLLRNAEYTAIDSNEENIQEGRRLLRRWAEDQGFEIEDRMESLFLRTPRGELVIHLERADVFDFVERWKGKQKWDLIVAHAFLDLMDIPAILPLLREQVVPGGWFLFTLNFDGVTIFEPTIEAALDDQIVSLYHRSMDERQNGRKPGGDSRSGRHLFQHLRQAGLEIVEAGSSDWVVFARDGQTRPEYAADEAYFLEFILHFFEDTLQDHPELDRERFQGWLNERRAQIQRGELVYIAHQIDFLARRPLQDEPLQDK
jgi:SAM-dependent methyltransferase